MPWPRFITDGHWDRWTLISGIGAAIFLTLALVVILLGL